MLHGTCPLFRKLIESQLLLDSQLVKAAGAWLSFCKELFELQRLELNEAFLGSMSSSIMRPGSSWSTPRHSPGSTIGTLFNLTEEAMSFVRARLEEAGLGFWDVDRLAAAHSSNGPAL